MPVHPAWQFYMVQVINTLLLLSEFSKLLTPHLIAYNSFYASGFSSILSIYWNVSFNAIGKLCCLKFGLF